MFKVLLITKHIAYFLLDDDWGFANIESLEMVFRGDSIGVVVLTVDFDLNAVN